MRTVAVILSLHAEDLIEFGLNAGDLLGVLDIRSARCFNVSILVLLLMIDNWRATCCSCSDEAADDRRCWNNWHVAEVRNTARAHVTVVVVM